MSIRISQDKCIKCHLCIQICPGNLIKKESNGKVRNGYPDQCWGCAACIKECPVQAISLRLGNDIGGRGGQMTAKQSKSGIVWEIKKADNTTITIETRTDESNKY